MVILPPWPLPLERRSCTYTDDSQHSEPTLARCPAFIRTHKDHTMFRYAGFFLSACVFRNDQQKTAALILDEFRTQASLLKAAGAPTAMTKKYHGAPALQLPPKLYFDASLERIAGAAWRKASQDRGTC